MTVRLEKDVLLWVLGGRPCVMVDGPVLFSCDTDDEAIVLKNVLEILPEIMGFGDAMRGERLSVPRMVTEAWAFILNASSRYAFDDGATLAQAREMAAAIAPADAAELEEMAGVVRTCRECGCTEDNACEGPCYWVELDLCSACKFKRNG